MIRAVIFDMDGTVVETTMTHDLPVWTALFQDYNIRLSLPIFQSFLGKKASEIFKQLVPGITEQQIETSLQKRDVLLAQSLHEKGLKTTPGFLNFLLLLQRKGILVALATGAGRKKVEAVCKYVPLKDYFPVIVTADDVARGKPHPDLFLRAAEKLEVKATDCITAEDAFNGIEASHKSGMKCIAIATTHTKDELQHADKIIDSFDELNMDDLKDLGEIPLSTLVKQANSPRYNRGSVPNILIVKADGTNCDEELAFAFNMSGGNAEIIHVNQLRNKEKKFSNYNILAFAGGFAYGDDIVSGKILATELTSFFSQDLKKFVERKDTLTIGICNGFQVLIRTGLLPFGNIGKMDATLTNNEKGLFECRWVKIKQQKSRCVFLKEPQSILDVSVNHGEGRFFASSEVIQKVENEDLVAFRYVDSEGKTTQNYPENPNGSTNAIAGVCDPTGRILGMMPHPEKFNHITNHPNWRRMSTSERITKPHGLSIFENMIDYVQKA